MTNYIVETIEEQTRITTLENTDVLSGVRGAPLAPYDMSFEVRTLVAYIQSQVTSGTIVSFGSDRTAIASPANGQVFFDTDDGIVYQYATVGGWTAKMDFVSSAELTTAIAGFLTQSVADARYVQSSALNESVDDRVAALLVAGTNTTLAYNDTANTLTIAASIPNETIDDRVAALLLAGSNISLTYDDTANTLTIASTATSSGGGATGIKYTLNTAAGTPAAGEIRSADLAVAGTIAISATDAATPGKSAADILAKVKVGAIIVIAKSQTEQIRATVTTDYTVGSGSFAIAAPLVDGAIGNGAIVFLSIASDAPSAGGGVSAGSIIATASADSISLTEVLAPSGFNWVPLIRSFYRGNSAQFPLSSGTLLSGSSLPLNDSGLTSGTYYYRMIVADQAGTKAATAEVFATAVSTAFDASTIAGITAVEATGVTLTGAQKTAANNFMVALKNPANGTIWTKIKGLYILLGGTAAAHAVNWRIPGTNNINWVNSSGLLHSSNGVKGNAIGFGLLGFTADNSAKNSNGIGLYAKTGSSSRMMGTLGSPSSRFLIENNACANYCATTTLLQPPFTVGSVVNSRNNSSSYNVFVNGIAYPVNTASIDLSSNGDPVTLLDAATNGVNSFDATNALISSFVVFNEGLTAQEGIAYTNLDLAYQTELGRQ
jgi:hypothetical protein